MLPHGGSYSLTIGVRVAVTAQMGAAVVRTDVPGNITGTFAAVVGIWRQDQVLTDGRLEGLLRHAAGAVGTDTFKYPGFTAGPDGHRQVKH